MSTTPDDAIREKAKKAARTTDIDCIVCLGNLLRGVKVNPRALNILDADIPAEDRILLHAYDLLHLATYGWYKLQEEQSQ